MHVSTKTKTIMALLKIKGIGPAKVRSIYAKIPSCDPEQIRHTFNIDTTVFMHDVEKDINYAIINNIKILSIADPKFPVIMNPNIPKGDLPVLLYYIGNIDLIENRNNNVAIIGTRTPSKIGELSCTCLTKEFVKKNYTIVSGLANGCDKIAHTTALRGKGHTIAVLPTPPNTTKINTDLASNIIANNGLLISEYLYPDKSRQEYSKNCARRNKLLIMFSKIVFLIEGNLSSGSEITMRTANSYKVKTAAILPQSEAPEGCFILNNNLLRTHNAMAVTFINNQIILSDFESVLKTQYEQEMNLF